MKKYIVMSIIAVVALLPFAAWADTGGSATATLTFDAIINTVVDGSGWGGLTIKQNDGTNSILGLAGAGGSFPIAWGGTSPNIKVKVQSIGSFEVYSSYGAAQAAGSFNPAVDITAPDAFLYLDETTSSAGSFSDPLKYKVIVSPTSPGYTDGTATGVLTPLGWTGTNNLGSPSGGEERLYDVQWDPSKLANLNADDAISLTIYFIVTEDEV